MLSRESKERQKLPGSWVGIAAFVLLVLPGCIDSQDYWQERAPWCPDGGLREWRVDVREESVEAVRMVLMERNWTQVVIEDLGHYTEELDASGYVMVQVPLTTVTARCFGPGPAYARLNGTLTHPGGR